MMWRYPGTWSGSYGIGGIGMGIGMILNLLVLIAVIYLVVRLFRGNLGCYGIYKGHHGPGMHGNNLQEAVNIINRRYASGEITREEYNQVMEDLNKYRQNDNQN